MPGFTNNRYTVGWISAGYTEYVAAQEFLDEQHNRPASVQPNDQNTYTLGRIGKHNVVIAVLPDGEYGIASASSVASNMLTSFPNVKIGLMVGIAGGAPSEEHDVRLGDVVVGASRNGKGSVFAYRSGRLSHDQDFQQIWHQNEAPPILRSALTEVRARYERKGHRIEEMINEVLDKNTRLRKKYRRPDPCTDVLFQSTVVHISGGTCKECGNDNSSSIVSRPQRTEEDLIPAIHYGTIASGDLLMNDALVRDRLAAENGVVCFEMEAAGLMNRFPCLVIRGIYNYSDSHKNNEWQGYAAMAAAAFAKDIVNQVIPSNVDAQMALLDKLQGNVETITRGESRTVPKCT